MASRVTARPVSAADGGYRFRTIRPVPLPRPHRPYPLQIGGRGIAALVTQLYVAGEPRSAGDGVLNGSSVTARERVIVAIRN